MTLEFGEWQKVELKAAKVLSVEDLPGKDKLYKLRIDLGGEQRQLIAGIKPFYAKEKLVGRTIVVIANLQPRMIAGLESQGMLLAVKNAQGGFTTLTVDDDVPAGTRVE